MTHRPQDTVGINADLLTVGELLAVPELRLVLVAGQAGVARPVRWTHATELVDPAAYLRGRELVLTLGSALVDDTACARFAAALRSSGVSAIAFGLDDVLPRAPAALREQCDRWGLPLLEVPRSVPFLTISEYVAERLVAHRTEGLSRDLDERLAGSLLDLVWRDIASTAALDAQLAAAGLRGRPLLVVALSPLTTVPTLVGPLLVGRGDDVLWLVVDGQDEAPVLGSGQAAGLSRPQEPGQLRLALREARAALELGLQRGHPVTADALTSFDGLLDRLPDALLAPFAAQLAAPLAEHDAQQDGQLLPTLAAFLDADGSVTVTARALFLHVNSVRHRLLRIAQVTGRDPLDFADRVALTVALRAWSTGGLSRSGAPPG